MCCAYCFYNNLHYDHKLVNISDIETLKKENITIESTNNDLNDYSAKMNNIKNRIETEINKINNLYEKTIDEMTNYFQKKYEQLLKQENDLKEKLQNEVTKTKECLENFLSETNNEIIKSERIKKGIAKIEKENNNMSKVLSYVSKINKTKKDMKRLIVTLMKNIKFTFDEIKGDIIYEDYYFNGICSPKNIQFKDITTSSLKIFWDFDQINMENIDNNKISFKVEMKRDKEKFKEIYRGNDNNYLVNDLSIDFDYEFRVCSFFDDLIGPWSEIKKINLANHFNITLKDSLKNKDLLVNEGDIKDEIILLKKNGVQFGPYKHYPKGKYLIVYYGENLFNADFDIIDNGIKVPNLPLKIVYKSNNQLSYETFIPDELKSGIEFRAFNRKDCLIRVSKIEVYMINQ